MTTLYPYTYFKISSIDNRNLSLSILHQELLSRVTSLVGAMQHYVTTNTDSGLTDVSASLEVLISQMLHITEGLQLTRMNLIHSNFPAIDLADSERGIAIQVTSNVTTAKWRDTVDKFTTHGLDKKYKKLRIIGFCKAVTPRNLPSHVTVHGPKAFLAGLNNIDQTQMQNLERLLRESYDFSKLSPLRDEDCFRTVLDVLDRDAIRHHTSVEGSFKDLTLALKEVKEIINAGSIPSKNIYAKALSQYSSPYENVLRSVDLRLANILAELNRARRGEFYYLVESQNHKIDDLRSSIILEVNDFCRKHGINREIVAIR